MVTWRHALAALTRGQTPGIFALEPNEKLAQIGTPSFPILLQKWMWFHTVPLSELPNKARVAVLADSNEQRWLEQQSFPLTLEVQADSLSQMINLVQAGRVDAFLADYAQTVQHLKQTFTPTGKLSHSFARYAPMHLYFSNHYLERYPELLGQFNSKIEHCIGDGFQLSEFEQTILADKFSDLFTTLTQDPHLLSAVKNSEQELHIGHLDVATLDQMWLQSENEDLALRIINSKSSQRLRSLTSLSDELITEAIVSNQRGLGVGITRLTTDFWQGDEAKFINPSNAPEQLHLSDIDYDSSTRSFLVHASKAMLDPESGEFIGSITLGINISALLEKQAVFLFPAYQ
ncbi:hypothetical protein GCM10025776_13200 [Corallincola platygyrae]